jgi:hypothetical protein
MVLNFWYGRLELILGSLPNLEILEAGTNRDFPNFKARSLATLRCFLRADQRPSALNICILTRMPESGTLLQLSVA